MPELSPKANLAELVAILNDEIARTPEDVARRQTLLVPVSVDCVLPLRVAAAEAVWRVGGRHDLALPFLTWALKDGYWGASRQAAEVLGEMGSVAHEAVPELVMLVLRRLDHGPFHYEEFDKLSDSESLLTVLAKTLGRCGLGSTHLREARKALSHIASSSDEAARSVAKHALGHLRESKLRSEGYDCLPGTWQSPTPRQPVDKTRWRECDQCGRNTPVDEDWQRQGDGTVVKTGTCTYVCAHCEHGHVGTPIWSDDAKAQSNCHNCDTELGAEYTCPQCSYPRGWMRVECPNCAHSQPVPVPHWVVRCDLFHLECVNCENAFDSLCIC